MTISTFTAALATAIGALALASWLAGRSVTAAAADAFNDTREYTHVEPVERAEAVAAAAA